IAVLRGRAQLNESFGVAHPLLRVMPGEGPASMTCSAGLGEAVDVGPSPGMTGSNGRAELEADISQRTLTACSPDSTAAEPSATADTASAHPACRSSPRC